MFAAFGAMLKIFFVSCAGVYIAKFPKDNVLMPPKAMQYFSRISNAMFLPFLVLYSMGSIITPNLLKKALVLILFSVLVNVTSLCTGFCFEKLKFHDSERFGRIVTLAIGTPNQLSLPIMVMQSMCTSSIVNADYDDDEDLCTKESMSLLFVYSIGFNITFWSFGYLVLESIVESYKINPVAPLKSALGKDKIMTVSDRVFNINQIDIDNNDHSRSSDSGNNHIENSLDAERCEVLKVKDEKHESTSSVGSFLVYFGILGSIDQWSFLKLMGTKMIGNINMVAIYIAIIISVIPHLQDSLFGEGGYIRFAGDAIKTLGEPLVCINGIVMSGSLALVGNMDAALERRKQLKEEENDKNGENGSGDGSGSGDGDGDGDGRR